MYQYHFYLYCYILFLKNELKDFKRKISEADLADEYIVHRSLLLPPHLPKAMTSVGLAKQIIQKGAGNSVVELPEKIK